MKDNGDGKTRKTT